jgi:hypothetical protein
MRPHTNRRRIGLAPEQMVGQRRKIVAACDVSVRHCDVALRVRLQPLPHPSNPERPGRNRCGGAARDRAEVNRWADDRRRFAGASGEVVVLVAGGAF